MFFFPHMKRCVALHMGMALRFTETPNPQCLAYHIPRGLSVEAFLPDGVTCDVPHLYFSEVHPLSEALFDQYQKEVLSLFIAPWYVTVTKHTNVEWHPVDRSIGGFLGHYLMCRAGGPVLPDKDYLLIEDDTRVLATDSEVVQCIKELIKEQVRPMVQRDGGDVRFLHFNDKSGIVSLTMLGACRSCPSSKNTLKDGIERVMQHFLPEVKEVVEVKGRQSERMYDPVHTTESSIQEEINKYELKRQVRALEAKRERSVRGGMMTLDELLEPD